MAQFLVSETDPPAKRAILREGLDLFAARGVDGVTIRDIAARTGFTNPALFRHFKSKDALALALFESCYGQLAERFGRAARDDEPLRELIGGCLQLMTEAPEAVHYVLENLRRFFPLLPDQQRRNYILGSMRKVLTAEQRRGLIATDADVDLTAAVLLGTLAQLARMAYFGELTRQPAALADDLWDLVVNGIGVRGSRQ